MHHKPNLHSVSISRVDILSTLCTWHMFSLVTPHSNLRYPNCLENSDSNFVCQLQCENCKNLKYLRNVYCVMTNHSKDQDMQTIATKPQTDVLACGSVFSRLIGLFLATQKHSRNISGVHSLPFGKVVLKLGQLCLHFSNINRFAGAFAQWVSDQFQFFWAQFVLLIN